MVVVVLGIKEVKNRLVVKLIYNIFEDRVVGIIICKIFFIFGRVKLNFSCNLFIFVLVWGII